MLGRTATLDDGGYAYALICLPGWPTCLQGVQPAAYDQSDRSFDPTPTFVLMAASAR